MSEHPSNRFGAASIAMAAVTIVVYLLSAIVRLPFPAGIALITSVAGVAFGIVALVRVRKGREASRTMAILGIVVGSIIPLFFAIAITSFVLRQAA